MCTPVRKRARVNYVGKLTFMYQAGSWSKPRRVVFKIEKPKDQLTHLYTFIVTTLEELLTEEKSNPSFPSLMKFSIFPLPQ